MSIATIIKTMRPAFLVLTPICVFLGASLALSEHGSINILRLCLITAAALLAHISVNMLNEYSDFKSGLDLTTERTPFSGGSGALPAQPCVARLVLNIALTGLGIAISIGVYFAITISSAIWPFIVIGTSIVLSYTDLLNRRPWLCFISPGLGFGLLMVTGTDWVLTERYNVHSWLIAIIPFLLLNNLLLLNQFPDLDADAKAGRKTLPITYGVAISGRVLLVSSLLAVLTLLSLIFAQVLPLLALIALAPISLSFYATSGAIKYGARIGAYPHYMAANVIAANVTPLVLGVAILAT